MIFVSAHSVGNDFVDFLSTLNEFNCRMLKERILSGTLPFLAIPSPVIELLFQLCRVFQLPPEVKYLALEIFDRYFPLGLLPHS